MNEDNNIYLVSEDKVKKSIDAFSGFLSSGDAQKVLGLIGEVSTVVKGVKLVVNIRNWHIARKIKKFIENLDTLQLDPRQFQELINKYGKDKVCRDVILSLDSMRSEKQASAFAYLFAALLREELTWEKFCELQSILEKIDSIALDEDFNDKAPSYRLMSVGLAYVQASPNGVTTIPNGKLYNDFKKFIVTPYKDKIDKSL